MSKEKIKVLNLYACLGGNRYKWDEVANIEVTAVELDSELCKLYKERFPHDNIICDDAHEFLLKNYSNYDFIWSSPPCPTHSKARFWGVGANGKNPKYPNFSLYQEIVFLQTHFKGKFCVENVVPYYKPLIPRDKRGRHIYWANFKIPFKLAGRKPIGRPKGEFKKLCKFHNYDFAKYNGTQNKVKIARNLVDYQDGKIIFEHAVNCVKSNQSNQLKLI